jgi:putative effector of murein hydrolase LrgA (UPF0299 family)
MIRYLALVTCLQAGGSYVSSATGIAIPGSILGLIALLVILPYLPWDEDMTRSAHWLTKHLALLVIPSGVGILSYLNLIEADFLMICIALIVSTVISCALTALAAKFLVAAAAKAEAPE